MKQRKVLFLIAALVSIMLSTVLSSCSSDDNEPNRPSKKMLLTGLTIKSNYQHDVYSDFEYNEKGNIVSYKHTEGGESELITYSYSENRIIKKLNGELRSEYILNKGLIIDSGADIYDYKDGYLYKWNEGSGNDVS